MQEFPLVVYIVTGARRRTLFKTFFKSLHILTLSSIYIFEILMFYCFESLSIQTGTDVFHTVQDRQTYHRTEFAANLSQNIFHKLFNKLPKQIQIKINSKNLKILLITYFSLTELVTLSIRFLIKSVFNQ